MSFTFKINRNVITQFSRLENALHLLGDQIPDKDKGRKSQNAALRKFYKLRFTNALCHATMRRKSY
jgi:hypothetical protein